MKRARVIGVIALVLAGVVLLTGVFSLLLRGDNGLFSGLLASSDAAQAEAAAHGARIRAADTAQRRVDTAASAADRAIEEADAAKLALEEAMARLDAHAEDGEALHALYYGAQDALGYAAGTTDAVAALDGLLSSLLGEGGALQDALTEAQARAAQTDEAVQGLNAQAERMLLTELRDSLAGARDAVDKAEEAVQTAHAAVAALEGVDTATLPDVSLFPFAVEPPETVLGLVSLEAVELAEKASWLRGTLEPMQEATTQAAREAAEGQAAQTIDRADAVIHWLATYYILIWFTGILLLAIGVVLTFFAEAFFRQWRRNPVFSTSMALLLLLIVQTYSMRFTYASFGDWGRFWLDNAFNVLRANTSVGMIALGMTLVIITGGIDLAVGSTLAGVGTVVMVLIDTSSRGILVNLGITGIPAFVIGILGGFATGALIGALIGLGVTKGRVPPFIITLGVMNIVRSLAQYFTKSYTPRVPTEFTAISNTVVFGQRLLPIVYWLVLAVILYFVMERTRFGRYVYAVGSNERTTRLSGINVDRVKFKVYTLMGLMVSVAAVTQVSRLGGMDVASAGNGYELDAIAAVVVGGTSMSGGRGSIVGTVIGVLIIGVMNNLLILLGVDSFLTNAFKGAIVVAAVLMQRKEKEA